MSIFHAINTLSECGTVNEISKISDPETQFNLEENSRRNQSIRTVMLMFHYFIHKLTNILTLTERFREK